MSSGEDRFKEMVESSPDWHWEFDENAIFTYVSPRIKDLLGYEPDEILGKNAFDLMSPEEADRVHQHFDPIAKKYQPFSCLENTNIHKDGREVIIESSGTPIFDEDGTFRGYRGIDRDVTAQRLAETKFQQLFNEMMDAFSYHQIIRDEDGNPVDYRFLEVNPAFERMTGLKASEIVGRKVSEVLPTIEQFWIETFGRVALTGEKVHFRHFSKELGRHYEVKVYRPRQDCFACVFLDVTEHIEIENQLKNSEVRFRSAFVTIPDPVVLARLSDGKILDVNQAFEEIAGIPRVTAIGHNSDDLGLWDDPAMRELFRHQLQVHGEMINLETKFRVRGNLVKSCKVSAKVFDIGNEPHLIAIIRDISTEKEAEKALLQMDQVKSEFISTAAHELRTPLSTMLGYTELLLSRGEFGEFEEGQKRAFLQEIFDTGEALTRIVDDLLDISRIESGQPIALEVERSDIVALINRIMDRYRIKMSDRNFIHHVPETDPGAALKFDPQRLAQVLENLLSNAAKYSPSDSDIIVETRFKSKSCQVSVVDHGIGMDETQLSQVFDKFYRADSSDTAVSGLGLGMSIAKQIVEAHGGEIWMDSRKGEGTKASFWLPLIEME
ncbi:MAG: hypothetical protein C0616_07270 [Desulfuromonas sp.]|nr:MAG: hypothetical protein C0616_07270 [Desulfuromonas sp.]